MCVLARLPDARALRVVLRRKSKDDIPFELAALVSSR